MASAEAAKFLERCSDRERSVFDMILSELEKLSADPNVLGAPEAKLWVDYAEVAAVLKLKHPKLKKSQTHAARLLSLWPSEADRVELPNSISMSRAELKKSDVKAADIDEYGKDLQQAGFDRDKTTGWRTMTFRDERADRLGSIFAQDQDWGRKHLVNLQSAVRALVQRINNY